MIQVKAWGTTELIFKNDNFEVHRIAINGGGYCSRHMHRFKYNMFFVETGKVMIRVFNAENIDTTIICTNEKTIVAPGIEHQFEAESNSTVYEIYYTEPIGDDIIRMTVGGMRK